MKSLRLSLLVAMARNRVIGRNNKLPWHLPADLKHFKFLTMGQTIVMGRKTYESIGKPLPGRINIIITRQAGYEVPGATVVSSIDDALLMCEKIRYITEIQRDFEGDVCFPEVDPNEWEETQRDKHISENDANLEYHFVVLDRKVSAL